MFIKLISIVATFVLFSLWAWAMPPNGGYLPWATLDPDCAPGDTDCVVQNIWIESDPLRKFVAWSGTLNAVYTWWMVGVGTDNPSRELDVEWTTRLWSNLYIGENTIQPYVMTRVISEDTTLKLWASRSSNGNAVYVWSQTNSPLSFIVGDTNKAIIDTDGNMWIGTLTPDGDLTIERTDAHAKLNVNNKDTAWYTQIRATAWSVSGYLYSMWQNYVTSWAWRAHSSALAGTGTWWLSIVSQNTIWDIRFYAGWQSDLDQVMTITNEWKVWIWTDEPNSTLETKAVTGRTVIQNYTEDSAGTDSYAAFQTSTPDSWLWMATHWIGRTLSRYGQILGWWSEITAVQPGWSTNHKWMIIGTKSDSPIILGTNNTERLRIENGWYVWIWTENPSEMLEIWNSWRMFVWDGWAWARKWLLIDWKESTTWWTDFVRLHAFDYWANDSLNMVINPYGAWNVWIMTSDPKSQLQVWSSSTLFTAWNDNLHLADNLYYDSSFWYKRVTDDNETSLLFMWSNGDTIFYSNSDTNTWSTTDVTLQNNLTIKKDWRVWIWTSTPEAQLHIAWNIKYEWSIQQWVSWAHIKQAFYKYSNWSSGTNKYVHLKTNQPMNSKMMTLKFYWFEYGSTKTIDAQVSYYPYGTINNIHSQDDYGTHELWVYKSSDWYAVVTIKVDNIYHLWFYVDAFGPGPQWLWSDIDITDNIVADAATGEF